MKKIVLAYSGGLDTSIIVHWLKAKYGAEVVCYCCDVGQGSGEMDGLVERAMRLGASDVVVEDLKHSFVQDFAFPTLREETRATTFYTTGTTGLPKGVYYSHRQLVLHTLAVSHALGSAAHATFGPGDVYMPITPMFHVHAWGLPYLATLLGAKQVYPGRYVPDVLLGLIRRERVTLL